MKRFNAHVAARRVSIWLAFPAIFASQVLASWPTDPNSNLAVCFSRHSQLRTQVTSDAAGGAIVSWEDRRFGNPDIFAARVLWDGRQPWRQNGERIQVDTNGVDCTSFSLCANQPQIDSDGVGGALLAWRNELNELYAQRIDAAGNELWGADDILVATGVGYQGVYVVLHRVVHDGAQGALVAWSTGTQPSVFVQRISADGQVLWSPGGVAACAAPGSQTKVVVAPDDSGGAILAWMDQRSGPGEEDIYAQRVDASGTVRWGPNGRVVDDGAGDQDDPRVLADGTGGAFVSYHHVGSGARVQRLNPSGDVQWGIGGVSVSALSNFAHRMVSDGYGGVVFSLDNWTFGHGLVGSDVRAQRIDARGNRLWGVLGVRVCSAPGTQGKTALTADGAGGAYFAWEDDRSTNDYTVMDVYAQRLDERGSPLWTADGVPVSTAMHDQGDIEVVRSAGGIIVAWVDWRADEADVYAQHVTLDGVLGTPATSDVANLRLGPQLLIPNPIRLEALVTYRLLQSAPVVLSIYDVRGRQRLVRTIGWLPQGTHRAALDVGDLPSGAYVLRLGAGSNSQSRKITLVH